MTVKSMTGFARHIVQWQGAQWQCEIRSVNGRNMDLRLRLPDGCDFLEPLMRQEAVKTIRRGSVNLAVSLAGNKTDNVEINQDLLQKMVELRAQIGAGFDNAPMRFEQILAVPGIVQFSSATNSIDPAQAQELYDSVVAPALRQLDTARIAEGANLQKLLSAQLDEIQQLTHKAESRIAPQAGAMAARLKEQLAAIGKSVAVDEQRIAQELAVMAIKADVREELDRLQSHIKATRELLASKDVSGRKLDFLCQEFNREANTLCSKSADIELTQIGLQLKNIIDQLREQAQNIE